MVVKEDQERVKTLISDTVTLLCRNGLTYKSKFCINALIGITLDERDVFLVDIRETIKNAEAEAEEGTEMGAESDAISENEENEPKSPKSPKSPSRKRKKHRKRSHGETASVSQQDDSASETGSVAGDTLNNREDEEESNSEPPAKRTVKKEEVEDEDDSQDLVFIKDEPAESDLSSCSFGNITSSNYSHQQQQGDILGNLAQHGQLYATPETLAGPNTSWDQSSQGPSYSQAMPTSSPMNTSAANMGESPSQPVSPWTLDRCFCSFCHKGFKKRDDIQGHLISHHGLEHLRAACHLCDRSYSNNGNMRRHVKSEHGIRPDPHSGSNIDEFIWTKRQIEGLVKKKLFTDAHAPGADDTNEID